jgi:hypothetical protein
MVKRSQEALDRRAREGPKKSSGGNTRPDAAWIEEIQASGELHEPDESTRPAGFLYDTLYQWDGYADEVNIDFFEAFWRGKPTDARCNGTAYIRDLRGGYIVDCEWERLKRPCLSRPSKGAIVCQVHGAKIPQVRAAAQRVIAEAAEVVALRLVGLTDFADEKENPIAHKDRISASNSVLDRAGVKGGTEVEITLPGYKKVMDLMFTDDSADDPDGE